MKANEFRLGSFFGYKGCIYAANVIRDNFIYGKNVNGFAPGEFPLDKINPILLTEEWLLKFGFDKSIKMSYSTGVEVTFNFYEKSILTYNSIQNCWRINDLILYMQPEYVHELQNLYFAMTGQELILNEKL